MLVPDVIVLDGAQRTALACVRSLGAQKLKVAVADCREEPLAATSRYCSSFLTSPDPRTDPERYLGWIADLGRKWPGVVVLPVTDVSVPLCLAARDQGAAVRTALPPTASYGALTDKFNLARLAAQHSLQSPRTFSVTRANIVGLMDESLRFPVVVKPRWSAMHTSIGVLRRSVSYATDARELRSMLLEQLVDEQDEFLVQEYVKGYGFGIFAIFNGGRPVQFFAHRRVREKPPSGGVSVLSRSEHLDQELGAQVSSFLSQHSWHGVAMLEFKRDDQGRAWLIEVNARLWGSVQLPVDCGVDFPAMLYQLATNREPSAADGYAVGRQLRWLLGDLDSLYLTLRSKSTPTLGKLVSLLRFLVPWSPGMRYELLRFSDPMPAACALREFVVQLMSRR